LPPDIIIILYLPPYIIEDFIRQGNTYCFLFIIRHIYIALRHCISFILRHETLYLYFTLYLLIFRLRHWYIRPHILMTLRQHRHYYAMTEPNISHDIESWHDIIFNIILRYYITDYDWSIRFIITPHRLCYASDSHYYYCHPWLRATLTLIRWLHYYWLCITLWWHTDTLRHLHISLYITPIIDIITLTLLLILHEILAIEAIDIIYLHYTLRHLLHYLFTLFTFIIIIYL